MGIVIRKGGSADIYWVANELVKGSKAGHFASTVAMQATPLLNQIVLNGGNLQMLKVRNGGKIPCVVKAFLLVAEMDGTPAGFLINLFDQDEVEIHLGGTVSSFRRNGIFRRLVEHEIDAHTQQTKRIFARCYKKSTWAINAFQSLGFEVTTKGNPIELTFKGNAC